MGKPGGRLSPPPIQHRRPPLLHLGALTSLMGQAVSSVTSAFIAPLLAPSVAAPWILTPHDVLLAHSYLSTLLPPEIALIVLEKAYVPPPSPPVRTDA
jgi:hypothetical protein